MNKIYDLLDFLGVGELDYETLGTQEKVRKFAESIIDATSEKMERLQNAHTRSLVSDNYCITIRG